MESRLDFLTRGPLDLPAHQRTLAGTIEWSYALLEEAEKTLFRRLAVFVGGCTLDAIEAVCMPEGGDSINVLDGISSLVDRSLLRREDGQGGETRFAMLETIREYAGEKLEESAEAEDLRRAHALYFLSLAEEAEKHLQRVEQADWFKRLEVEHNNLRAAISWSLTRGEEEVALRFGAALMIFWYNRYPAESRWWLEGALKGSTQHTGPSTLTHARALHSAALALRKTREYPQARALINESLRMYTDLDDKAGVAASLHRLADLLSESGTPAEREQAKSLYLDALDRFRAMGDKQSMSKVLNSLGERHRTDRDFSRAIDAYEQSIALGREVGDIQGLATTQTNLAYALYRRGDYERAKTLLAESLDIYRKIASAYSVGWALIAWAGIERVQGQTWKAARLIAFANRLVAPGGAPFDQVDQLDRQEIEADIRAALSDDEWQRTQDESHGVTMDQAIEYALLGT